MLDKDIDAARDSIRENLDMIVDRLEHADACVTESMTDIYNICNGADENNWRDCMEKIQDITRGYV